MDNRVRRLACLAALVSLAGCSIAELRREIFDHIEPPAELTGAVTGPEETNRVVVVLVQQHASGRGDVYRCAVLPHPGPYSFLVRSGTYRLFAFADRNGSATLDRDEPAAWHGSLAGVRAYPGAQLDGLDITLQGNRAKRDKSLDAYESVPDELRRCVGREHAGDVAGIRNERFSAATGKRGLWDPVGFEADFGTGVWMLQPYHPDRIPVVFVHGAAGCPQEWSTIVSSLDAARFQPWVFQYASGARLDSVGDRLADAIAELRRRYGFSKLFVVAHSMGGLVSRAALPRIDARCGAHVVRLFVTISTPWLGHDAAQLGVRHSPFVIPSWKDMSPGSAFLRAVRAKQLSPDVTYYLFFGYRGGETLLMHENSDESVTLQSVLDPTAQDEAARIRGFFEDHESILRSKDVIYELNRVMTEAAADRVAW